ncbi:hypothetical protein C1N53_05890 [Pontibacter sp. SGAir0037]|nr:hypothetical protein C1N53_05890 [Pontibacter sp. SGAir0037]
MIESIHLTFLQAHKLKVDDAIFNQIKVTVHNFVSHFKSIDLHFNSRFSFFKFQRNYFGVMKRKPIPKVIECQASDGRGEAEATCYTLLYAGIFNL